VRDGPAASVAEICGSAADLDCWLWNRPPAEALTFTGDEQALTGVRSVVTEPID
jgi:hypothetical protein